MEEPKGNRGQKIEGPSKVKKPYAKPALKIYGNVREITQKTADLPGDDAMKKSF